MLISVKDEQIPGVFNQAVSDFYEDHVFELYISLTLIDMSKNSKGDSTYGKKTKIFHARDLVLLDNKHFQVFIC